LCITIQAKLYLLRPHEAELRGYGEEKHTIYTMLDAFVGKKKLKDALKNVLHDVK